MPRPRIHDDELRTRLLEVAARLLAEQGPHALSLRTVAAEAGTSTTAIYSLLGSKQELVRGLYLEGFQRFSDGLHEVPPLGDGDPLARLDALDDAYFTFATSNPHFYSVMFGPPLPDFCPSEDDTAFALTTLQVLIDALDDCIAAGLLPGPADQAATRLWAVEHGVASLANAGMLGTPTEARTFAKAATTTMLAGLRARPDVPATISRPGGSAAPRPRGH